MVVWLEDSVVKLFDFSHFSDLISLLVVSSVALDVDTDADAESNDGNDEGDSDHHNNLVVVLGNFFNLGAEDLFGDDIELSFSHDFGAFLELFGAHFVDDGDSHGAVESVLGLVHALWCFRTLNWLFRSSSLSASIVLVVVKFINVVDVVVVDVVVIIVVDVVGHANTLVGNAWTGLLADLDFAGDVHLVHLLGPLVHLEAEIHIVGETVLDELDSNVVDL